MDQAVGGGPQVALVLARPVRARLVEEDMLGVGGEVGGQRTAVFVEDVEDVFADVFHGGMNDGC